MRESFLFPRMSPAFPEWLYQCCFFFSWRNKAVLSSVSCNNSHSHCVPYPPFTQKFPPAIDDGSFELPRISVTSLSSRPSGYNVILLTCLQCNPRPLDEPRPPALPERHPPERPLSPTVPCLRSVGLIVSLCSLGRNKLNP